MFAKDIPVEEIKKQYSYPESAYVQTENYNFHYRKKGSGKVMLLLHGINSSLHTWEAWFTDSRLNDYTLIALDVPGFGFSSTPINNDFSTQNIMAAFGEFFKALEINSCQVVGNSLGGKWTWNLALNYPNIVKEIVLLDASGYKRSQLPLPYKLALSPFHGILRNFTPRSLLEKSVRKVYGHPEKVTQQLIDRYYALFLRAGYRDNFKMFVKEHFSKEKLIDHNDEISKIQQKTLIIWGEKDSTIPVSHAHYFKRDIKDSELVIYPNLGHVPMEEEPQLVITDVLKFLAN